MTARLRSAASVLLIAARSANARLWKEQRHAALVAEPWNACAPQHHDGAAAAPPMLRLEPQSSAQASQHFRADRDLDDLRGPPRLHEAVLLPFRSGERRASLINICARLRSSPRGSRPVGTGPHLAATRPERASYQVGQGALVLRDDPGLEVRGSTCLTSPAGLSWAALPRPFRPRHPHGTEPGLARLGRGRRNRRSGRIDPWTVVFMTEGSQAADHSHDPQGAVGKGRSGPIQTVCSSPFSAACRTRASSERRQPDGRRCGRLCRSVA